LPDYSAAKADQSGRGHISKAAKRTTKRDIIKIGTTDVVIQGNDEGPMIFVNRPIQARRKTQLPAKQLTQDTLCPDGAHRD
jgi:hypothetical protein